MDFTAEEGSSSVVTRLLDETLQDPGIVEVGYAEGLRVTGSYDEALAVVQAALVDDPESVELLLALASWERSSITVPCTAG